jgi:hypothetical protein
MAAVTSFARSVASVGSNGMDPPLHTSEDVPIAVGFPAPHIVNWLTRLAYHCDSIAFWLLAVPPRPCFES